MLKRTVVLVVGLAVLGAVLTGCQQAQVQYPANLKFKNEFDRGKWLQDNAAKFAFEGKRAESQLYYREALKALESFRKQRVSSPLVPAALIRMGECYEALGDNISAMKAYQEVVNVYPASLVRMFADENIRLLKAKMAPTGKPVAKPAPAPAPAPAPKKAEGPAPK